jgi:hypothetical protein
MLHIRSSNYLYLLFIIQHAFVIKNVINIAPYLFPRVSCMCVAAVWATTTPVSAFLSVPLAAALI